MTHMQQRPLVSSKPNTADMLFYHVSIFMSINNNINEKEQTYWVALSTFLKFGAKRLSYLQRHFPDMETAYHASAPELFKAGIPEVVALEFIEHRKKINPNQEIEKLKKENINVLILPYTNNHTLLREMPDAPQILYYKGDLSIFNNACLAVVGSRKYSLYGQRATEHIIHGCVAEKLTIVSGLALGIDAISHAAAIKNHGSTIAVLGSGVDNNSIYPANNRYLAQEIIKTGNTIVSEFPFGTPAFKHHFPQRNRIIAGLSLGTLVVEASQKSGALITARYALEYNREVFAIPGSIFNDNAKGVNGLIKSGAKLVESAQDVISELGLSEVKRKIEPKKLLPDNEFEAKIITALTEQSMHINQIAKTSKLDTSVVNATLLNMELKKYVINLGGGNYALA